MEFKTEAQKAVYEKVLIYGKQLFGEMLNQHKELPSYAIEYGSAFVFVNVIPWRDTDAVINIRSWVVTGAEITQDLLRYLLKENYEMTFGAFGVDDEGDIEFEHTIVGSTCDIEEFRASVLALISVADAYDDQIRSRWGGQRACDRTG